jgi:hypothetical protein
MIGLCLSVLGTTVLLPVSVFTLSWQHSIEKTQWEERWRIEEGESPQLVFVEGRIHGSGAGMEPPPRAKRENGVWVYEEALRLPALHLAHSPFASPYRLCPGDEACHALEAWLPGLPEIGEVELFPCSPSSPSSPPSAAESAGSMERKVSAKR